MNEEARVDPAPGSDEARVFVVREDCPLHGTATQEESTDEQS